MDLERLDSGGPRTVAIVQARMGSTRLPGKVLKDLEGEPLLTRVINRLQRAGTIHRVVIATTNKFEDDAIVEVCRDRGWDWFRGSELDVLDRYYKAAVAFQADIVVRVTSDCPLIDPAVVDMVVRQFHLKGDVDYLTNTLPPRTFPRGLDVEVIAFSALKRAWNEATDSSDREHVTPYIYKHPELFRLHGHYNRTDLSYMRWTVDTEEDLALVRKIYAFFGSDRFTWRQLLAAFSLHPGWLAINRHIHQKVV